MCAGAKMIFGAFFFFAEKNLLSRTETTAQCYLWLYHSAVVKGIPVVPPMYMYTQMVGAMAAEMWRVGYTDAALLCPL